MTLTRKFVAAAFLLGILLPKPAFSSQNLFFASDVHYQLDNLSTLLWDHGTSADLLCLLGDYASSNGSTTISEYKPTYYSVCGYGDAVLTQGNHDGDWHSAGTGWWRSGSEYELYVINVEDFLNASEALGNFLDACNEHKVVFVASHYPLHSTRMAEDNNNTGYNTAAQAIFSTLQEHGQYIDIVFLWGHNHHGSYDNGVNYVARPGQKIGGSYHVISSVATDDETAPLKFTYLNAGYVNPKRGTNPSATVVTVNSNNIIINRYGNLETLNVNVPRIDPQ